MPIDTATEAVQIRRHPWRNTKQISQAWTAKYCRLKPGNSGEGVAALARNTLFTGLPLTVMLAGLVTKCATVQAALVTAIGTENQTLQAIQCRKVGSQQPNLSGMQCRIKLPGLID